MTVPHGYLILRFASKLDDLLSIDDIRDCHVSYINLIYATAVPVDSRIFPGNFVSVETQSPDPCLYGTVSVAKTINN